MEIYFREVLGLLFCSAGARQTLRGNIALLERHHWNSFIASERSKISSFCMYIWDTFTENKIFNIRFRHMVHREKKVLFWCLHFISTRKWPDPTQPGPIRPQLCLTSYISEVNRDIWLIFWQYLHTLYKIVVLTFETSILNRRSYS